MSIFGFSTLYISIEKTEILECGDGNLPHCYQKSVS
jgi:hypothetical protein